MKHSVVSLFRNICSETVRLLKKRNKLRNVPTNPIDIQSCCFRRGKQFNEKVTGAFVRNKQNVCRSWNKGFHSGGGADSWIISVCIRMLQITRIISLPLEALSGPGRICLISPTKERETGWLIFFERKMLYNVTFPGYINTNDHNNTCHVELYATNTTPRTFINRTPLLPGRPIKNATNLQWTSTSP